MKAENRNKEGCPCADRLETEKHTEARSDTTLQNPDKSGAGTLLAKILERDNLNRAYKRVKANKGAPGIDGMSVEEALPYLKTHGKELITRITQETYKPQPVKRVEIPKPDGGIRQLGIPTVIDRVIQMAIAQVLEPIFEPEFSESSFGFRPGRNAHQSIGKAKEYYDEGNKYVVDIDLEKYFDTVNHDLLIRMIREKVRDKTVIALIRKYLKSGVMINGVKSATTEGTPQGGPLSPLLSNIYLTKFDRMLEERGHKFVRYADDCNIYVQSQRAAERVLASCTRYLEEKLKLRVNRNKSCAGKPTELKFLGFALYENESQSGIRVHVKSLKRFKARLKQITKRSQSVTLEVILSRIRRNAQGWLAYYRIADMRWAISNITKWLRRRIRMYLWLQWKRPSAKYTNLRKLGATERQAREWSNTRKGSWRIAKSWVLTTTLTNKYLASLGFYDISEAYARLHTSC